MKTIATAPDAIAYLQELKRLGWEDPHFCLPEDAAPARAQIKFTDLSDEFAALIAERRECQV
jgi:hypothetical protein